MSPSSQAVVLSIILVLSIFSSSVPAWATFPGSNGKIAFVSDRDGDEDIYTMNPDGSNVVQLTSNTDRDWAPAWSPNGLKIAYAKGYTNDAEIYLMNADGSGQIRLTSNTAWDAWPSWSSDGTKIVFNSNRTGNYEVFVMNVDGSNVIQLTSNSRDDFAPAWSPDGSKIAFSSNRISSANPEGDYEIYVMNTGGESFGLTQLTNNTVDDNGPDWSPDGSRIVFISNPLLNWWEIYAMNADGTGRTRLTDNIVEDLGPVWSPDGLKIVFSRNPAFGDSEILIMNADGAYALQYTNNTDYDGSPDWQPITTTPTPTPPPPTAFAIHLETIPSDRGTIVFVGSSYHNGDTVSKAAGTYSIGGTPGSGYQFSRWEASGLVTIADANAPATMCTVSGNGTLRMIQSSLTPTPTPTPPPRQGCIIASATYGSELAPEVLYMRHVRDDMIGSNEVGRMLVEGWNAFYYSWSPPIAEWVINSKPLQIAFRILLLPLVAIVHCTAYVYAILMPIGLASASVVGFLFAGTLSTIVYIMTPVLTLRTAYKRRVRKQS